MLIEHLQKSPVKTNASRQRAVQRGSSLFIALLLVVAYARLGLATDDVSAKTRSSVLADAQALSASEPVRDEALTRLNARPRAEVLAALRELVKHDDTESAALKAIGFMKARELLSDLATQARSEDRWELIATVNGLLRLDGAGSEQKAAFAKIYNMRLDSNLSSTTKMAFVNGLRDLHQPISFALFERHLKDDSDDLRESVVQQFLLTRDTLALSDQLRRFRIAFRAKPYTVRLEAMEFFNRLPRADRRRLRGAVEKDLCKGEIRAEIKRACAALVSSETDVASGGER